MLEFAGQGEMYKQLVRQGSFSDRRSSRVRFQEANLTPETNAGSP